jgi:hypothetical protein
VSCFKKIEKTDLAAHPIFGPRLKLTTPDPIARIADIKAANVPISRNPNLYGIPQGTPISSALSNLYMIDVDMAMSAICRARGALYQRYSDDILVACRRKDERAIVAELLSTIKAHKLEIKPEKTERVVFNVARPKAFQYLGFNILPEGAYIRPGSLSRQWRKAKRSLRRAKRVGEAAIRERKSDKVYTKKLRGKLSPVGPRNFSSYARNSAKAFGSKSLLRPVLRLERMIDKAIRDLNKQRSSY